VVVVVVASGRIFRATVLLYGAAKRAIVDAVFARS
jgi:hypothetical protein